MCVETDKVVNVLWVFLSGRKELLGEWTMVAKGWEVVLILGMSGGGK